MQPTNILYTAHVHATGGREGRAESDDGALAVTLSTPKALGGPGGSGTNPEQLFGAGYAGCFLGALKYVASQSKIALPASSRIDAEVGIGPIPTGFALRVKLRIQLPGINPELAEQLVAQAHQVCPYSNATRGNIEVTLEIIDA